MNFAILVQISQMHKVFLQKNAQHWKLASYDPADVTIALSVPSGMDW